MKARFLPAKTAFLLNLNLKTRFANKHVLDGAACRRRHLRDCRDRVVPSTHRVHDAARPGLAPELLQRLLQDCRDDEVGGLLALPVADTLKQADQHGRVETTISRTGLWAAQTPQMFRYGMLLQALLATPLATDESSAMEALGFRPKLVLGDARNFKLTYPHDLQRAQQGIAPR
jgi:2-C-methyl-D-erythritol 4-phosphate cytidylyltransferase